MKMLALFLQHILITLVGSAIGGLLGAAIGFGLSRLLIGLYDRSRRAAELAILVPWRTGIMGLLVPFGFPTVAVIMLGIGAKPGIASIAAAVAGMAAAFTAGILVRNEFPVSQTVQLIAAARTVSTGAATVLVIFGSFGSGGLGFATIQRIRILQYEEAIIGYLLILLAILVFDLLGGIAQYVAISRGRAPRPA